MFHSINRTGIQNLDLLTSTDMAQAWGKLKMTPMYEACKLQELCHVQSQPRPILDEKTKEEVRQRLIAASQQSALALHYRGRLHRNENGSLDVIATMEERILMSHVMKHQMEPYREIMFHDVAFHDATAMRIYRFSKNDLTKEELQFYESHVQHTEKEALQICADTRGQNNTKWRRERKLRITGSRCHTYFTYVPKDAISWENKVSKMLADNFTGNHATRYGKECEQSAINKYSSITRNVVTKIGFIIHPKVPWLGYSPDGIVFKNSSPAILLEVKSPLLGKTITAAQLAKEKKLAYIKNDGENFILNPTHAYFSQVQLGMFLLNLTITHFVVYSQVEPLILTVHKNDKHIDKLVRKLQFVYFKHLLPKLAGLA